MNNDVLFEVFQLLPLTDLLNASLTCIQFNNIVFDDYIWHRLCERDYPESYKLYHGDSYYDKYKVCYQLSRFMGKCKKKHTLNELYHLQELNLSYNQLTEIPKELGQLNSLQRLDLSNNQLTEIPKELGQLNSLQRLFFV